MGIQEKSENLNSLRPILFELCKKNYRGGGQIDPPPAGIGLIPDEQRVFTLCKTIYTWHEYYVCLQYTIRA